MYAACALLVSHWPVDSNAATSLTTSVFSQMSKDASAGRAEALRRAMLTLLHGENDPLSAHPSVWAPFVLVGDGAAAIERSVSAVRYDKDIANKMLLIRLTSS